MKLLILCLVLFGHIALRLLRQTTEFCESVPSLITQRRRC